MASRARDIKPLFYLYQLYKFFLFYPLLGIGWSVLFSVFMAFFIVRLRTIAAKIAVLWARYSCLITPMSVRVTGLENLDPSRSYVLVANHQSQYDIFVIYGWLPVDFKWVLKIELRKVPIIGPFCHRMGHVFVDRSNTEAALAAINSARERIRNGTSIMFFPEGTRSRDGKLLPFKKGAFNFAVDIGLPVLPLSIIGTKDVLPDKTTALFPGRAHLVIHRPIPVEIYDRRNLDELMARARDAIQAGLDEYGDGAR
jgi:1-acyl-sn-glycerol-3-phosphate acyltransferase